MLIKCGVSVWATFSPVNLRLWRFQLAGFFFLWVPGLYRLLNVRELVKEFNFETKVAKTTKGSCNLKSQDRGCWFKMFLTNAQKDTPCLTFVGWSAVHWSFWLGELPGRFWCRSTPSRQTGWQRKWSAWLHPCSRSSKLGSPEKASGIRPIQVVPCNRLHCHGWWCCCGCNDVPQNLGCGR